MTESVEQTQSLSQYGKLLVALSAAGIDYAVVGGLAANLKRMLTVLRGWGEGCKANSVREKDQLDVIALKKIIEQQQANQP